MTSSYNGLGRNLGNLSWISEAHTRSISAENPTGGKGMGAMVDPEPDSPARELGRGWKVRPYVVVGPQETAVLADIEGPGAIQSMWFGGSIMTRDFILRIYWEGQEQPSVETPLTDFFAVPFSFQNPERPTQGPITQISSLPVAVNPNRALNCFWEMPFRQRARITIENRHPTRSGACYYQVNYCLTDVPEQAAYFHAQFRRTNPLPYLQPYTILDGVQGRGHYVGTSMGISINNNGWWGEGEVKFYIDGDGEYPTICGTGTEDYFGGAYNFDLDGQYTTYTTPFVGMHQVLRPDGTYQSQHRQAMYRWHVMDPINFREDLKVTIQALGWRSEGRFLPGQHDICSVAYWYQTLPAQPFPPLPDRNGLEVV
jgi:hypothetical protein